MKRLIYNKEYDIKKTVLINMSESIENIPKEYKNRFLYDDISLYKIIPFNTESSHYKTILKKFPEFNSDFNEKENFSKLIATPIGLYIAVNDNEKIFIVYDIFEYNLEPISEIKPDISLLKDYKFINNPLSIRKVNFKNNFFIPDREYYDDGNNKNIFVNADIIRTDNCENEMLNTRIFHL